MYDMKKAEERILEYCAERAREDAVPPEDIACALMNEPGVLRMHGPEHHFLTAASLCAAWCAVRRDDARPRLERLRVRCAQIPAGVCGYYGVCGDTLAAGAFLSEILGATYLSGAEWQVVNNFTARVQSGVAASCTRRAALLQAHDAGSHIRRGIRARRAHRRRPAAPGAHKMHLPRHEQPVHRKGLYLL